MNIFDFEYFLMISLHGYDINERTMELRIKNCEEGNEGVIVVEKWLVPTRGRGMASRKNADSPFRHRMTFVYLSSGIIIRLSPP